MKKWLKPLGALIFLMFVSLNPQTAAQAALCAMTDWAGKVAPAVFPFLIAIPALTCRESCEIMKRPMKPVLRLFGCPAHLSPAVLTGWLGGSPASALAAAKCADGTPCTEGELLRCVILSSGASPAFLLGVAGGYLAVPAAGWKLLTAQLLSGMTTALFMRPLKGKPVISSDHRQAASEGAVWIAVKTMLLIGGYMIFFSVIAGLAAKIMGSRFEKPVMMLMELSGGCRAAAEATLPQAQRAALMAAVCCLGGVSVCMQSGAFLTPLGIRLRDYVFWKLVQSGWAAACMLMLENADFGDLLPKGEIMPVAALCLLMIQLALSAGERRRKKTLRQTEPV